MYLGLCETLMMDRFSKNLYHRCLTGLIHFIFIGKRKIKTFCYFKFITFQKQEPRVNEIIDLKTYVFTTAEAHLEPIYEHLRWSFFANIANGFYPLTVFAKKLH